MLELDFTEEDVRKGELFIEGWDPIVPEAPSGGGTVTRGLLRKDGTVDEPWKVTWEPVDNEVYTTLGTWENMPDAIMRKCLDQETPLRKPLGKVALAAQQKKEKDACLERAFSSAGWTKLKAYVEQHMNEEDMKNDGDMTKEHRLEDAGLDPVDIIEGIAYMDKIECNKIILGTSSRKKTDNEALFDWFVPVRALSHTRAWKSFLDEICAAMTNADLTKVAKRRLLQDACMVGPDGPKGPDDSVPVPVEDLS